LSDLSFVPDVLSCGRHYDFTGKIDSSGGIMGIKMNTYITNIFFRQTLVVFTGVPLLIWAMGNFPERSVLKESLCVITILAFCQMIGQLFWTRMNGTAVQQLKMRRLIRYHKIMGGALVVLLLCHPFFMVIPRFFESGISPVDAFFTILTTMNQGVVLGIIAWCLMLVLGITAFAREKLPMTYKAWRVFHGLLALLLVAVGAWHAIDLGRHFTLAMSILIILMTTGGSLPVLKTYAFKKNKKPHEV
jgi:predicted ferric reductase